jgi:hypothetical protein
MNAAGGYLLLRNPAGIMALHMESHHHEGE